MPTVLIVDDSNVMRKIIQKQIKAANLVVDEFMEAGDGKEGLEKVKEKVPDLILCDWNMPNMTGIEFIKTLHSTGDFSNVPIVMITTEGSDSMRAEAAAAGAKGYITKPFTPEQLVSELGNFLMVS
ncbi:MAG: response regulator [Candidatus Anammoxibacter sp.]